jgi:hypothetical protein
MAKYRLILMSEALPGQEEAYTKWSNDQHLPDIMRIPGVVGATRLQLHNSEPDAPGRFMAIFDCEKPAAEIMAEMKRRNGTPEMPAGAHHNRQSLQFLFGDVIGSW